MSLDSMDSMEDLLDSTLDDLEDLPEFKPFQPGAHKLLATFSEKVVNDKPAVELELKLVETIELSDTQAEADAAGTTCSTLFFLDNQFGRGNLKKCAKPFAEALNYSTIREVVEGVKEVECLALTSLRKNKEDPDKPYLEIKEIQVA